MNKLDMLCCKKIRMLNVKCHNKSFSFNKHWKLGNITNVCNQPESEEHVSIMVGSNHWPNRNYIVLGHFRLTGDRAK